MLMNEEDKQIKEETKENNGMDNQSLDEKLKESQTKCDEYLNGWKRALADYQNLKKEVMVERETWGKFALAEAAANFIPVYENLKTAWNHKPGDESLSEASRLKQWIEGLGHIKNQMAELLKTLGVEEIKTVGEKFDARSHEIAGEEIMEGKAAGEIIREVSGGYKIGDKVIKAAKVVVITNN